MKSPALTMVLLGLKNHVEEQIVDLTLEITANLIEGTPVDTGWARSGWVPSIGVPYNGGGQPKGDVSGAVGQQESGKATVVGYGLHEGAVFVSNNVPYIEDLNDGHSQKAPSGFVERSIEMALARDWL